MPRVHLRLCRRDQRRQVVKRFAFRLRRRLVLLLRSRFRNWLEKRLVFRIDLKVNKSLVKVSEEQNKRCSSLVVYSIGQHSVL